MYSILVFIALLGTAFSCSCVESGPLEAEFHKVQAVFVGRVLHKTQSEPSSVVEYKMKVEEAFKVSELVS